MNSTKSSNYRAGFFFKTLHNSAAISETGGSAEMMMMMRKHCMQKVKKPLERKSPTEFSVILKVVSSQEEIWALTHQSV